MTEPMTVSFATGTTGVVLSRGTDGYDVVKVRSEHLTPLCTCGCGAPVPRSARGKFASDACRQRAYRRRTSEVA